MLRDMRDAEICLCINEFIFIYDLYKANNKNYDLTLEYISNIEDNRKREGFHIILLKIIDIDNYKDEKLNQIIKKNNLVIPLDSYKYSNKIIKIYKELFNKRINYEIFNEIMKSSFIILIKSGQTHKHLIQFKEVHISSNDLIRIMDNDYTNDTCLICLENINDYPSFRIFNCCFSKTCSTCFKTNDFKCPICNMKSPTLISY